MEDKGEGMSRNIEFERWERVWGGLLTDPARAALHKFVDDLDTLAQTKVGENMALTGERDLLQRSLDRAAKDMEAQREASTTATGKRNALATALREAGEDLETLLVYADECENGPVGTMEAVIESRIEKIKRSIA